MASRFTVRLGALALGGGICGMRWLLTGPDDSRTGLNRATMTQALTRLGELAAADGHTLTLVVVGGAAMVLR